MSLDWIGLSAFVIIDRNSQKKKNFTQLLECTFGNQLSFWSLIIPRYGALTLLRNMKSAARSLLRSSPTAAWREGPNALDTVSVFSFPNANMSVFHERALVYHLRVIFLNTRLREPQLNNSKHVPCSSLARSAPQDPVTVVRLKSPFNFPQSGYSNTLARGIK